MIRLVIPLTFFLALISVAACNSTLKMANEDELVQTTPITSELSPPRALEAMIFVANQDPAALRKKIAMMERPEVIHYLYELSLTNSSTLQPSRDNLTVVYALFGRIPPGTIVSTGWEVERDGMSRPYSETYDYTIEASTPQSPVIILNGLYNENPGVFDFEVRVGNKTIASTSKTYVTGLN